MAVGDTITGTADVRRSNSRSNSRSNWRSNSSIPRRDTAVKQAIYTTITSVSDTTITSVSDTDTACTNNSPSDSDNHNVERTPNATKPNIAEVFVSTYGKKNKAAESEPDSEIQSLLGNTFNEDVSCKVYRKIEEAKFSEVVENVSRRFKLSAEKKKSILEGSLCEDMHETITYFGFDAGKKTEPFIFGRVATVKYEGKIDMAYSFYTLEFKLPSTIQKRLVQKTFLFFFTCEKEEEHKKKRHLNCNEREGITEYITAKTMKKFRDQYEGMINID
jgi:hypothetical protein